MSTNDAVHDVRSAGERMSSSPRDEGELRRLARLATADLLMVLLAIASLVLLAVDEFNVIGPQWHDEVVILDLVIVLIFVAEYIWRLTQARPPTRFLFKNWFELLGMVPLILLEALESLPQFAFLRAFRLIRVIRLGAALARFVRAYNAIVGDRAAEMLFKKYRAALIEEVSDRVVLSVIAQVEANLVKAKYAEAIGLALEARRAELGKAVLDALERNGSLRHLVALPPASAAVTRFSETTAQAIADFLKSPEFNLVVSEALAGVLANVKSQFQDRQWRTMATRPATQA
ncbi:MAG TPA: ion transporter [Candidatus Thermoplasmatota archaeon]|nr:ion transporter [Candidatus Thermoplasmatota archaeon]